MVSRVTAAHRGLRPWARAGACLVAFAPFLTACSSIEGDFDVSPLYRSATHPATHVTENDAGGPLGPYVTDGRTTMWGLRPLFFTTTKPWDESAQGEESATSFIAPFGKYHTNPRATIFRFWPLIWWGRQSTAGGAEDVNFLLFPIVMWGSKTPPAIGKGAGERESSYFALFPLIGRADQFLLWDRFEFIGWPIFQRLTKRVFDDEEQFWSVALLGGWTTGAPRGGSWHILPLYYQSLWTYPPYRAPRYPKGADPSQPLPRYEKYSYLWPFVHHQKLNLDREKGQETELWAVWPLFKREWAYDHDSLTILWPFFRINKEYPLARESGQAKREQEGATDEQARSEENTNEREDYGSQVVYSHQKTIDWERHRILLILFGSYHSLPEDKEDRVDSTAFLLPIGYWNRYEREISRGASWEEDATYALVPIFQWHTRYWLDVDNVNPADQWDDKAKHTWHRNGKIDRFVKMWPLFSYEDGADGRADFQTLVFLPLRLDKYVKDFNDAYGFLWNLYRRQAGPMPDGSAGGWTRHTAIFNLFKAYTDPRETTVSIPLICTWRTVQEGSETKWTRRFIAGLFGMEGSDGPGGSTTALRLFGFKIPLG